MYKTIKGAKLIDGTGAAPLVDSVVVIADDIIEAVGRQGETPVPPEGEIIDAQGMVVIPGLIDAHIHLDMHGMADTYDENLVEDKLRTLRAAREMADTLRAGFTTVRNLGSCNGIDFAVKTGIEAGYQKGPRIITSGKIISMTCSGTDYFSGMYRIADGVDECRKAAREQLRDGADCLKLMATGAVMNPGGVPGAAQLNVNEMRAVVEEGRKLGYHTAAHAHGDQGIKNAIRAGCRTIEHGTMADDRALELMAETGTFMVPTMSLHDLFESHADEIPQFILQKSIDMQAAYIEIVSKAIKAGVKLALGTDAGTNYNYHGNNAAELVYYVKNGIMSSMDAIVTATQNAAKAIMMDQQIGTIEPGKLADMILLKRDPITDINVIAAKENIWLIFKGGKRQH